MDFGFRVFLIDSHRTLVGEIAEKYSIDNEAAW